MKKRGKNDIKEPCKCRKEIGFVGHWLDKDGTLHVECEACSSGPRFPYYCEAELKPVKAWEGL
jgi:hypothetical protein